MYYNDRLIIIRQKRGLTQKQLSELIGIRQQQYARYEQGINIMPVTILYKICIALNISADYLLCLTNEIKPIKTKEKA